MWKRRLYLLLLTAVGFCCLPPFFSRCDHLTLKPIFFLLRKAGWRCVLPQRRWACQCGSSGGITGTTYSGCLRRTGAQWHASAARGEQIRRCGGCESRFGQTLDCEKETKKKKTILMHDNQNQRNIKCICILFRCNYSLLLILWFISH